MKIYHYQSKGVFFTLLILHSFGTTSSWHLLFSPPYPSEGLGILRPIVVDEDAGSTGKENHDQRYQDVTEGHQAVQVWEAVTVYVEQQRHHAQSQYGGAGGHHNAGEQGHTKHI